MYRLRFHGRGGQGARVASKVLGTAAFLDGYYAQDFPLYGAERRGAPVAASTRIAEDPIMERGVIPEPDIVIVMDETLLQDPLTMPLSGLKPGGIVVINTTHSPVEAKAVYNITAQVLTLDITKIGLDMLGMPILSTLAGGVAARIVGLSEDSLTAAVKKVLSEIITDRKLLDKNVAAALYCFNAITPAKIETKIEIELKTIDTLKKKSTVISLPFEPAAVSSPAINSYYTPRISLQNAHRLQLHLLFRPERVNPYGICIFMHHFIQIVLYTFELRIREFTFKYRVLHPI